MGISLCLLLFSPLDPGKEFKVYNSYKCSQIIHSTLQYQPWVQNLRQGIVMKTSFETRVSWMGLGRFVDINLFVMKYYLFTFFIFSIFLNPLKSKSTQMLRPQKGNWGVSFNNTLLNFGLRVDIVMYWV